MKKIIFKGCGTAIVTPFTESGVNFEEFRKLIEFQIKEGVDSIIVCGTTGEAATMSEQERKDTIKFAVDVVNTPAGGSWCNSRRNTSCRKGDKAHGEPPPPPCCHS